MGADLDAKLKYVDRIHTRTADLAPSDNNKKHISKGILEKQQLIKKADEDVKTDLLHYRADKKNRVETLKVDIWLDLKTRIYNDPNYSPPSKKITNPKDQKVAIAAANKEIEKVATAMAQTFANNPFVKSLIKDEAEDLKGYMTDIVTNGTVTQNE